MSKKRNINSTNQESFLKKPSERIALHYGEVKIIPGISCDSYILDDSSAVMSERGFADLLGMDQKTLNSMRGNWPPKTLEPFIDKGLTMSVTLVKVEAENSPYKGRDIVVYDSSTMESIIRAYALAFAHGSLRQNQIHLGKRASVLLSTLVKTSLFILIQEACGFTPEVQKTVQRYYRDTIFASANNLLYYSLRIPYPDREIKKYQWLMATCFKYAYEQYLGKEAYKRIKENKNKFYPVHQYIQDETIRLRCVSYMALLANYIATYQCRIPEAKEPVKKLKDSNSVMMTCFLRSSTRRSRQKVIRFTRISKTRTQEAHSVSTFSFLHPRLCSPIPALLKPGKKPRACGPGSRRSRERSLLRKDEG